MTAMLRNRTVLVTGVGAVFIGSEVGRHSWWR
jgi:hypothetical protein